MNMIMNFLKDEEGATMVEYGVLIAMITAALIITIGLIGDKILAAFQTVETNL
jgi:pilus assembly protein Flp/PilA